MSVLRIYDSRPYLLVTIPLDDEGKGAAMVDRTGTADTFKFFDGLGDEIYRGTVGAHPNAFGNGRLGDLMLGTRTLVCGIDTVTITGMALAGSGMDLKVDAEISTDECEECWGTGFAGGLGRLCSKGCEIDS